MRESLRIDSPFMGAGMPKAYSRDRRERIITAVETGASRREAAERFEVSVASAVKWLQRWYQQRSAAPNNVTLKKSPASSRETERASPAWRPGDWRRSAWKMGDDHLRGRSASQ